VTTIEQEPTIAVGLMTLKEGEALSFDLGGEFEGSGGARLAAGNYSARVEGGLIQVSGRRDAAVSAARDMRFSPVAPDQASFTVHGVTIGVDFHWQRKESQRFQGALRLKLNAENRLMVINEVALESYITSVISSEMSATAHPELLRAHAVVSRSWLLAQVAPWNTGRAHADASASEIQTNARGEQELLRWYAKEAHTDFDVCADDHCQRYQGITKATVPAVFEAVRATYGQVLTDGQTVCDARFSKCCGGMTEEYSAAWDKTEIAYLTSFYDGEEFPTEYKLPLSDEANAEAWILGSPPAFCNTRDETILSRILPGFDQETTDFYRWRVTLAQDELQALLWKKLGVDFGAIIALEPVERAKSGRLVRLRIVGESESLVIGKELEIRRAFSPSHLYSSAFVVRAEDGESEFPQSFTLIGAGWGHGVGLCQIGAALMAERGYEWRRIVEHYYPGARLDALYPARVDSSSGQQVKGEGF
jgi:stage II sporulation protein D